MTHDDIIKALWAIRPGGQWVLRGDTLDDLDWLDETQVKPTLAEVEDAIANLPVEVPQVISDRQFFQQLAIAGICTQQEALDAVKTGTIPANLESLVAQMPADQQFGANMILCGATQFERGHPLTLSIGQAYGWTSSQIDDFFRAAFLL